MRRTLFSIALIIIGTIAAMGQNIPMIHSEEVEHSREYLRGNDFQKDLLLYVDMLAKTHPYYADTKHCAELNKRSRKMYQECGNITELITFKLLLARLASSLNDGHTTISYWSTYDTIFPIRLALDESSSTTIDITSEEHKELLGKEVTRINGITIDKLLGMARPLISADNEVNFRNMVKEYMMIAEFWQFLGMDSSSLQLTLADGRSMDIPAINKRNLKIAQLQKNTDKRVTAQRGVLFDYNIFEDHSICYLQFNQFADRLVYPQYPQLARFDEFLNEMFSEMEDKNIETLVVDLQYNSGGNSTLGDVLLSWLQPRHETRNYNVDVRMSELLATHYPHYRELTVDGKPLEMGKIYDLFGVDQNKTEKIDYDASQDSTKHQFNHNIERIFRGNVIFIEGTNSFSSATLLLTMARDNGIGTIIGEIPGGSPSHYGDILYGMLPNTNTLVTVSHKHFVRPNRELEGEIYITPDVKVELNDPNRDLAWEWIVENYGK